MTETFGSPSSRSLQDLSRQDSSSSTTCTCSDESCPHEQALLFPLYQDFQRALQTIPPSFPPMTTNMQIVLWQSCFNEVLLRKGQVAYNSFADLETTRQLIYQACLRLNGIFKRYLTAFRKGT